MWARRMKRAPLGISKGGPCTGVQRERGKSRVLIPALCPAVRVALSKSILRTYLYWFIKWRIRRKGQREPGDGQHSVIQEQGVAAELCGGALAAET